MIRRRERGAATGSLGTAHDAHTATLLSSGKVLVAGGTYGGVYLSSAELYDPATGTWTAPAAWAPHARHTATLLPSGKVLVAGGYNGFGFLSSAELYDPAKGTWSAPAAWAPHGTVTRRRCCPQARCWWRGEEIYGELSSAELYDPATGSGRLPSLATARTGHTATLLPLGKVLAAGGGSSHRGFLRSAELYGPGILAASKVNGGGTVDNQGNQVTSSFAPLSPT